MTLTLQETSDRSYHGRLRNNRTLEYKNFLTYDFGDPDKTAEQRSFQIDPVLGTHLQEKRKAINSVIPLMDSSVV